MHVSFVYYVLECLFVLLDFCYAVIVIELFAIWYSLCGVALARVAWIVGFVVHDLGCFACGGCLVGGLGDLGLCVIVVVFCLVFVWLLVLLWCDC